MAAVLANPEIIQRVRKSAGKALDGIDGISRSKPGYYWVKSSHYQLHVQVGSHTDTSSGNVIVDFVRPDPVDMCD
jgi:hypothetical protein